ncbi:MAG: hypothetical protein WCK80_04190 [bacterium]
MLANLHKKPLAVLIALVILVGTYLAITKYNSGTIYRFGKPAEFTGTFHRGIFENCCVNGGSVNTPYLYVDLPEKVVFKDGTDPNVKNMSVQIETNSAFSQLKEGQTITVQCGDLWEGNAGHYALSVYCKSPTLKNASPVTAQPVVNINTLKEIDKAGLIDYSSPSAIMNSCVVIIAGLMTNPDLTPKAKELLNESGTAYAEQLKIELRKDPNGVEAAARAADNVLPKFLMSFRSNEQEVAINAGTACLKALQ